MRHRSRSLRSTLSVVLLAATAIAADSPPPGERLYGFTAATSEQERAREARFDALLDPSHLGPWMERIAALPHHVGSPHGLANAEFLAELFRSWGYETAIERFDVLFPVPTSRRVELLSPSSFVAGLSEPPIAGDATSHIAEGVLPTYNAYSVDGDVSGELVYVNYGLPADYDELALRGIEVKGRIVLARYGGSWRGIKPKVAAEHGAIGCLIFSDPEGDGFYQGDPYPMGGYRPAEGAQRGSVADMPIHSGDPLTPGRPALPGVERLSREASGVLTKIPVLPLSWSDALPLLRALGGAMAPPSWRGALPVPYHLGPGPARVRLAVTFDWQLRPIYDVIARLPGSELPDEWVLRGNHHDAWVFGATDPVSGLVSMLEEARAIAELARSGARPRRTIVYAAWDGEEAGLLGSTEWAEAHAAELESKAIAYINSDSTSRGLLGMGGSHTFERLMSEIAREVRDPVKGVPLAARLRANTLLNGSERGKREARERRDLRLEPLGSGSDFTPFLQHLGVAALNLGFGGEDEYGQYHSIYDSVDHFRRFMDADFAYGVTQARVAGRAVLRLANADLLPIEAADFAESVARYLTELDELLTQQRQLATERATALDEKLYEAAASPREKRLPPPRLEPVPFLNLSPLANAGARLTASARAFQSALTTLGDRLPSEQDRRALNRELATLERALLAPEGLPGRSWYRHLVFAPGQYTGYGVKTFPAVREAIELRQWSQAEAQVPPAAAALSRFADSLDRATAILGRAAAVH